MTKRKMTKGASLYWLLFFDLRHQITPLVIFLLVIVLVVILRPTASDYPSIQWPKEKWQEGQSDAVGQRMTNNTMTKRKMTKGAIWCCRSKNGCYSSTYSIRLPLLSFFFWSLYWLSFFDIWNQIAPFVIFLLVIVLVVILRPTASDCPFCHFS
jgi:hypothetical protein